MNKKIITIAIVGILLLIGASSFATATLSENKVTSKANKKDFDYFEEQNLENINLKNKDFSYEHNIIKRGEESNKNTEGKGYSNGEIDLNIESFLAWRSPAPSPWGWGDTHDLFCTIISIKNVMGCHITNNDWFYIRIYQVYPDHEEIWINETYIFEDHAEITKDYMIYYQLKAWGFEISKKPIAVRAEIETSMPESNKENNELIISIRPGVAIWGYVYIKPLIGKMFPVGGAVVQCLADEPIYPDNLYYEHFSWSSNGFYLICAPVKPGDPPYKYTLRYRLGLLWRREKTTEPMYENEDIQMDFVFRLFEGRSRQSNPQSSPNSQPRSQQSSTPLFFQILQRLMNTR